VVVASERVVLEVGGSEADEELGSGVAEAEAVAAEAEGGLALGEVALNFTTDHDVLEAEEGGSRGGLHVDGIEGSLDGGHVVVVLHADGTVLGRVTIEGEGEAGGEAGEGSLGGEDTALAELELVQGESVVLELERHVSGQGTGTLVVVALNLDSGVHIMGRLVLHLDGVLELEVVGEQVLGGLIKIVEDRKGHFY